MTAHAMAADGRISTTRRWVFTAAVLVVCTLAAMIFGSRNGIEGDDLNMLFGMRNLDAMSPAGVYRYGWQPLAYDLFAALSNRGWTTQDLMALSGSLGALGFAALVLTALDLSAPCSTSWSRLTQVVVILTVVTAELWITALYFNTTALGLPFFVGGLWLALRRDLPFGPFWRGAAVGLAFSLAALMRLDYATGGLLIVVLLYLNGRRLTPILGFAAIMLGVLGAYALARPEWPRLIIEILTLYRGEVFPGWTLYSSTQVFIAGFGIPLVLMWIVVPPPVLKRLASPWPLQRVAVAASLLPMLLPASNLYSGKYLVPLAASLLLLLFASWGSLPRHARPLVPGWQRIALGWVAVAVLSVTGLVHPRDIKVAPVTAWFTSPFPVYTHDGTRAVGFFARTLYDFRQETYAPEDMRAMQDLATLASQCKTDLVIQMTRPIWFWAPVLFALDRSGWVVQSYQHEQSAQFGRAGSLQRILVQREPSAPAPFERFDLTALDTHTGASLASYVQGQRDVLSKMGCTQGAAPEVGQRQ